MLNHSTISTDTRIHSFSLLDVKKHSPKHRYRSTYKTYYIIMKHIQTKHIKTKPVKSIHIKTEHIQLINISNKLSKYKTYENTKHIKIQNISKY